MNITQVTHNELSAVIDLLRQNDLPVDDISDTTRLFALYEEGQLKGTVGIEIEGEAGLLRSLCVDATKRQAGSGRRLVEFIEDYARSQGVQTLYLLTTTAAVFFTHRHYETIERSAVPKAMQQTSEFASVCPASATVMKKLLP